MTVGIPCPGCGGVSSVVINSRHRGQRIYRRRECTECQVRYQTNEILTDFPSGSRGRLMAQSISSDHKLALSADERTYIHLVALLTARRMAEDLRHVRRQIKNPETLRFLSRSETARQLRFLGGILRKTRPERN